jgi:hypothetical protein
MRGRRGLGRGAGGRGIRGLALAGLLAFCGALAATPAIAFELPPSGNKNFTSPGSVPDYFSNEAGPFGRGSQTATQGADRFNTAPSAAARGYAAMPQPGQSNAASAGRNAYRFGLPHAGTARHVASSQRGRARIRYARGRPARGHPYARAASRHPVATRHRAAASHSRYAAHSSRHSRRVFR